MARHVGQILIYGKSGQVSAFLGTEPARVTEGYASWEVVARPRRLGLTVFQGTPPFVMELPIVLDAFASNDSVEGEIFNLEKLAMQSTSFVDPDPVKIAGPVPHSGLLWVIRNITQGLTWGREDGERVRQELTLDLLQFVEVDMVKPTAAETARSRSVQSRGTYIVRDGDTLLTIAANELDNASRWHEIAALNNIVDPRSLDTGDELRLP